MFRECNSFILFYFVRLIFFFFVFLFYTHLHFSVDCRPSGWRGNATEMEISIVAKSNRECVFKNNGSNTWKLRTEIQYSIFHILSCESFDHSINGVGRGVGVAFLGVAVWIVRSWFIVMNIQIGIWMKSCCVGDVKMKNEKPYFMCVCDWKFNDSWDLQSILLLFAASYAMRIIHCSQHKICHSSRWTRTSNCSRNKS